MYPLGGVTIQQEMGHYALFSVLRKRGPMVIALSVIAGYASWAGATFALGHVEAGSLPAQALEAWLRLALFRSWPFFVVGGAAFVIYRRWSTQGFREGLAMRPWTAVVVTAAVLMSFLTTYSQGTPGFFVLGFVALAAVLAICANQIPAIGPALRSIGKYSYFMYFMHFVILRWIQDLYTGSDLPQGGSTSGLYNVGALIVTVVIAAALSWMLGWVSWRVLESPVLNWTRRRIS